MSTDNNSNLNAEESDVKNSDAENIPHGNDGESGRKTPGNNFIRCDICSCEMSSIVVLTSHINGSRHKKKLKALEIVANLKAMGEKGIDVGSEISTNCYRCDICCLTVNSPQQLEIHLSGSKHRNKVAKEKSMKFGNITNMKSVPAPEEPADDIETPPPLKKKKKDEQTLTCDVCNICLNSEAQYEQHVYSKKHLMRAKGDNTVKKPAVFENEPHYPQNLTLGHLFYEKKEPEGSSFQHEDSSNQFRNDNSSNIIQVHSSDNHFNQAFNQSRSECGSSGSFNNYKSYPRHFANNRHFRGQYGGVGLYEVGRFFSKPRSHIFSSNGSLVQAAPRPST